LGLTGDVERLYGWLEEEGGPIAVDAGRPGLREVVLWTPAMAEKPSGRDVSPDDDHR
jgi:hypothetical protein